VGKRHTVTVTNGISEKSKVVANFDWPAARHIHYRGRSICSASAAAADNRTDILGHRVAAAPAAQNSSEHVRQNPANSHTQRTDDDPIPFNGHGTERSSRNSTTSTLSRRPLRHSNVYL
jgi:hypothetical protein